LMTRRLTVYIHELPIYAESFYNFFLVALECKRWERKRDECKQCECNVQAGPLDENLYVAYVSSALRLYSKNASVISEKPVSSFWRALSSFRPPVSFFVQPKKFYCLRKIRESG